MKNVYLPRKHFKKPAVLKLGVSVTTEVIPDHRFGDRAKRDRLPTATLTLFLFLAYLVLPS